MGSTGKGDCGAQRRARADKSPGAGLRRQGGGRDSRVPRLGSQAWLARNVRKDNEEEEIMGFIPDSLEFGSW